MILNQDNGNNDIIYPTLGTEVMQKFKDSKREQQIRQITIFYAVNVEEIDENLLLTLFKYSLIGIFLGLLLNSFDMRKIEHILMKWARLHQEGLYLIRLDYWDANQIDIISFQLEFIQRYANNFFSDKADLMTVHNQVAKKSNWKYSSWMDIEVLVMHYKKMLREILDHMIALPSDATLVTNIPTTERYIIFQFLLQLFTDYLVLFIAQR